jgi:glycosyltransferase involved in cell wall biosynthesis
MSDSGTATTRSSKSVSVALATFNGDRFLSQQLQSIASQSTRPNELLIGDDGSTDRTLELVFQFASTAPFPVRVIKNQERLGYANNFLKLACLAESELIAFCDQDDVWLPDKLKLTLQAFSNPGVLFSAHAATLINSNGEIIGEFKQGIRESTIREATRLEPWGVFAGFTTVIHKNLLKILPAAHRYPPGITDPLLDAHDRWTYFLANTCGLTAVISEPLALYRQHGKNLYGPGEAVYLPLILEKIDSVRSQTKKYIAISIHRAQLCRYISTLNLDQTWRDNSLKSALIWDSIAEGLRERQNLYSEKSRLSRMKFLARNFHNKVYNDPLTDRLSNRPLIKDVIAIFK